MDNQNNVLGEMLCRLFDLFPVTEQISFCENEIEIKCGKYVERTRNFSLPFRTIFSPQSPTVAIFRTPFLSNIATILMDQT